MIPRTIWLTPAELDTVPVSEIARPLSSLCTTRDTEYGKCGWVDPREKEDESGPGVTIDTRQGPRHNVIRTRKPPAEITPALEARICAMRRGGLSYDAIAIEVNVSHRQVYRILKAHGVVNPRNMGGEADG